MRNMYNMLDAEDFTPEEWLVVPDIFEATYEPVD